VFVQTFVPQPGDCAEFCALAHLVTPLGSGLRT
jgi:hypothetical protein